MTSSQRMAARRVAEGRDVSDHSACVPPPGMSVNMARVYRDKPPTQAPVVRMPSKTGHAASSAVPPLAVSASAASASASAEKAKPGARNALSGPTQSNAAPNNLGGLPTHAHPTAGPEVQPEAQSACIQALIGAIQEHTAALNRNTAALDRAAGLWP
ncbi:hypothetical protein D6C80_07576 [Aureobasidium pullulans]|nr:hypothetical protein D6C80_07576 [Aureobasidium pullulans]